MPNVLSPRDLVFRPDSMDETVPHTSANLHLGYIFGHVNGVLKICTRVQIYLHSGANLHPGANCAHERKCLISIYFDRGF